MYKREGFYRQKEDGARKVLVKEKILSGQVIFLGSLQMQNTSLILARKFHIVCFKATFLGEVETAVPSWFAIMGVNDPIGGWLFLNVSPLLIRLSKRKALALPSAAAL